MAGWQEHHTKTRAMETAAERVINNLVDPRRSLRGFSTADFFSGAGFVPPGPNRKHQRRNQHTNQ